MKLFYDLRLGYLVAAPGQETPLASLQAKAGDGEEVILQFGRSSDPTASSVIVDAPTWTAENLAGGTVIKIGIKEDGEYSDGTILASSSTFTHNAGAFTYTFALDLNTTEINTAMERGDANAADDIAELDCGFEVTFQVGGAGGWRSSVLPVSLTLYHDLIYGDEGTPTNAGDPTQYLLKSAAVEFYATVTSLTGGTSADLDYVPTVGVTVGKMVQFLDTDGTPDVIRYYKLEAGTDAESSPNVIRPDDYDGSTNAKVWKSYTIGFVNPMTSVGDIIYGTSGGDPLRLAASSRGGALPSSFLSSYLNVTSWQIPPSPHPLTVYTKSSSAIIDSAETYGSLFKIDTTSGDVTMTLEGGGVNQYCWFCKTSASNVGTIARGSGISIINNGADADLVLTTGVMYLLWAESITVWRIVSTS